MKNFPNIAIFMATFIVSIIFFGNVFINLQIKSIRLEVYDLYQEIDQLKDQIKRKKIEIARLTNPQRVLEYIDQNNLKAIPLENVDIIDIIESKKSTKKNE